MAAFFLEQMDYLFFVYGLGFLSIAAAAFSIYRNDRDRTVWFYLGLFGIGQFVWAWLEMHALIHVHQWLFVGRILALSFSFFCLIEGARRESARSARWALSAMFYIFLLVVPLVGWLAFGLRGVDVFIRYFYGLLGGGCFAWMLWSSLDRRENIKSVVIWPRCLSLIVFAHCLTQCVTDKASFFPVDIFNTEAFLSWAGFPIQLAGFLFMLAGVFCLWKYYAELRRAVESKAQFAAHTRYAGWLAGAVLVVLGLGWIGTQRVGISAEETESRVLLDTARTFAAFITADTVSQLSGTAQDVDNPEYMLLHDRAVRVNNSISDVRYVYLFGRKEGKTFFYFDSEADRYTNKGFKPTASPGDIYEDSSAGLVAAFKGETVLEGPEPDPWGNLFSALVPIVDPRNGAVVAVLGVDMLAKEFETSRLKHRAMGMLMTVLLLAIFVIFFVVQRRNYDIREALRESEQKYKSLFDEMLNGFAFHEIICDPQGLPYDYRFLDVNAAFEKLTGLSREQVVGKTMRQIAPDIEPEWIERYGEVALQGGVDHFERYSAPFKKYFECRVFSPAQGKFAVTFEDITKRKEAMESLATLLVRLQTQREFAVVVAHKIAEGAADMNAVLRFLTEAAAKAVNVERVGIWLGSEESGYFECRALYQAAPQMHTQGMVLVLDQCPLYIKALAHGDIIDARDARRDLRTGELAESYFKPQGIFSTIDAPIILSGKVIGVLRFEHVLGVRVWHMDEIRFASEVADQVEQLLLIHERRRAVEDLERHYAFLQILIDTIPNPVYFKDARGRYQDCNRAFAQMIGFEREDIIGKTAREVTSKELADISEAQDGALLATGTTQTYEGVVRGAGSVVHDVVFYKAVWSSVDGRPAGIVGVILDITERKRMELALEARTKDLDRERESLQIILDSTPAGLLLLGENGTVRRVNNTILYFIGYRAEEIIGRQVGSALGCVHAVQRGGCGRSEACTDCSIRGTFKRVLETGQKFTGLEINKEINFGGQSRSLWLELSAGPVMVAGERHVLVSILDITTRKQAELSQNLFAEVLRLLNQPDDNADVIKDLLTAIKTATGLDAVALRLRQGDDYPYYSYIGFAEDFISQENCLNSFGEGGVLHRDGLGRPLLDCTCGLVLSGLTDASQPFFTPGGSFWTNHASCLSELPAQQDLRLNPRNRCVYAGYMSLAIIPIRVRNDIIGILQLNDNRPGRFTLEMIQILEGIGASIGVALARKESLAALQESSKLNQQIMRSAQEGVVLLDREFRYQVWNAFMERLSGLSAGDVLGKHLTESFSAFTELAVQEQVRKALDGEIPGAVDISFFEPRSNRLGWLSCTSAPWRNARNEVIGVIIIIRDITEHKKILETLRESEEKFRTLVEKAPEAILIQAGGLFVYANTEAMQLFRAEAAGDLLGTSLGDRIHPDYHDLERERMTALYSRGHAPRMEERYIRLDGSVVDVSVSAVPFVYEGRPGALMFVRDVTERKQIEGVMREAKEELESLFALLPDLVCIVSPDCYFRKVNPAWETVLGFAPQELMGMSVLQFIHPQDIELTRQAIAKQLSGGSTESFVNRYRHRDGSYRWLEWRVAAAEDKSLLYATARDITELKRMQGVVC